VISRVRQARPLAERIDVWCGAIRELLRLSSAERLFELDDNGTLRPAYRAH
jgi:hypothetical protein